jgi:hypothetical protein
MASFGHFKYKGKKLEFAWQHFGFKVHFKFKLISSNS